MKEIQQKYDSESVVLNLDLSGLQSRIDDLELEVKAKDNELVSLREKLSSRHPLEMKSAVASAPDESISSPMLTIDDGEIDEGQSLIHLIQKNLGYDYKVPLSPQPLVLISRRRKTKFYGEI